MECAATNIDLRIAKCIIQFVVETDGHPSLRKGSHPKITNNLLFILLQKRTTICFYTGGAIP